MYYLLLPERKAIGPFDSRGSAYNYATDKLNLNSVQYAVKVDSVMQQKYIDYAIEPPKP